MTTESNHGYDPTSVDIAATERAAREKVEVAPKDAKYLIEATESAVDSLLSRLSRNSIAVDYLTEISARVQRCLLGEDEEPSPFAKALVKRDDNETVLEIEKQFVSEINPLLCGLRRAIVEHNAMTQAGASADTLLENEGGLINLLKTGKAGQQKTTSLFGFLEGLSDSVEFAQKQIVVVNPLGESKENKKYWQERMSAWSEVVGREQKNYAELIARRSESAVFELDTAAEEAEAKGDTETAAALTTIAQFIEERIDPMRRDFTKTVRRLSFTRARIDEAFDLFNAAEVVKHKNPALYARLLGVAQGRDSSETERSDLFGNIFHIAFYRTLHERGQAKNPAAVVARQVLRERLKGLTEIDATLLPLQHVNPEQMAAMQAELKTEITKAPAEQNSVLITALTSMLIGRSAEAGLSELFRSVSSESAEMTEEDSVETFEKARELFGENFFGPDQIEKAFTIHDQEGQEVKLIDLSPEERQKAMEMLEEKLQQPDIKQFLSKPENQKDIKDGKYLLVLRVNKIKVNGKNTNLTMKAMQAQIAPDMARNNQRKLLFNTGWYKDEDFYTTATPTFEWTLVTNGVVKTTLGKNHQTQTTLLTEEAQRIGLDPAKIHRRAPCETVFDRILFRTKDFLKDQYDWSDTKSGGDPVDVGDGDSLGLFVYRLSPGNPFALLGSSLSR